MPFDWTLVLASVILGVYLCTLSPSIAGGDSGELVAEGCILGTAHPPGYPLYTILIKLLSYLAVDSNVAYVVNIFSSCCTAAAALLIGRTVLILAPSAAFPNCGAIMSMGLFAFSPLVWQYAVTAEVFPLNTFFAALLLFLTVSFVQTRGVKYSLAGAFASGLALCNQHTIVLYEIPLILYILYLCRGGIWRVIVTHGLIFLLGLSLYAYLPLAASIFPKQGSWGHVSTVGGFVHHLLRRDYGTFQLYSGNAGSTEKLWERTVAYIWDVQWNQGLFVVPLLAAIGICFASVSHSTASKHTRIESQLVRKRRIQHCNAPKILLSSSISCERVDILLIAQLFYFLVFHSLANLPLSNKLHYGIHQRFWMQPNVLMFIWAGVGLNVLLSRVMMHVPQAYNRLCQWICFAVSILLVFSQFQRNLFISNQSDNYFFRRYATSLLAPLPENSLLLINYDMQWTSVRYVQQCEYFRKDVTVINLSMMTYQWFEHKRNLYPHIVFPGTHLSSFTVDGAFTMFDFMEANPHLHIYLGGKLSVVDAKYSSKYDHVPIGLVSQLLPFSQAPLSDEYRNRTTTAWKLIRHLLPSLPPVDRFSEETWEWTIGRDYKDRVLDVAAFALQSAIVSKDSHSIVDAVYWLESAAILESLPSAVNKNGTIPTALLKNIGLGHLHLIQNKALGSELPLPSHDLHNTLDIIPWPQTGGWKDWSSHRFLYCWGQFLLRPDAHLDSQYDTIHRMYESVTKRK